MQIQEAPLLRELTTLRLGGKARALVEVETLHDCEALVQVLEEHGGRPLCLGRGSNILADDRDLPFVLVRSVCKGEPQSIAKSAQRVLVRVDAGLALPRLLAWAAGKGLSGLEGLAGVPGQVGGSVAMNAGSYGTEIGQLIRSMRVFSPSLGVRTLAEGDFVPSYRAMETPGLGEACKAWWMIWDVELALIPAPVAAIEAAMKAALEKKRSTQPVTAASAGCIFRNPEGHSAGRLLDETGFRGRRLGGMAFSSMHANFLVNEGHGTSEQAFELIETAVHAVGERFGINLHREVKVWLSC